MKEYSLTLQLKSIPPVLLRQRQALILLRNHKGQFVLGRKNHYPAGISRLVGGGLEPGEDPETGAARELKEELGIVITPQELQPLAQIKVSLFRVNPDETQLPPEPIEFATYLYFLDLKDRQIKPTSDLDSLAELTEEEYQGLLTRYSELSPEITPPQSFSWQDYGQYFALVHQIALTEYHRLNSSNK